MPETDMEFSKGSFDNGVVRAAQQAHSTRNGPIAPVSALASLNTNGFNGAVASGGCWDMASGGVGRDGSVADVGTATCGGAFVGNGLPICGRQVGIFSI